jgi:hypothetical protein
MTIKDFGAQVADVWEGLRPRTQRMVVGALQQTSSSSSNAAANRSFSYDAHADWELSRLLTALDRRATEEAEARKSAQKLRELRRMADATARVLETQTESAEIFIQLVERALKRYDYVRVDALAASLNERFSAGEICEIVRQAEHAPVRALAFEALALVPISQFLPLLDDPMYGDIVRAALEQQALEYNSEDAKMLLDQLALEDYFDD